MQATQDSPQLFVYLCYLLYVRILVLIIIILL